MKKTSTQQSLEPKLCLANGMQTHVASLKSGYEKGVGSEEQEWRIPGN